MYLAPHETERFYRIWFELLHYVNDQQRLVPDFPDTPGAGAILPSDALQLRNALWADDALRERFIEANPAGLSSTDLALVESWSYRVTGKFFIMRHLKKYSVFLSEQLSGHAYGVLGLVSPIDEVVGPTVPLYVEAVLLPFEGQIIYDSLLQSYSISFGPTIRRGFNETYRNVQEREGIITSLEPVEASNDPHEIRSAILARNAKILSAFRKDLTRRGLSSTMVEQHASAIDSFAQTWLLAQGSPRGLLDTTLADIQTYLGTTGNKTSTTSFKRFVSFLSDTGRMDYEVATPLRNFLQHARA